MNKVDLLESDLLESYIHKIPKHDRECGVRISLTFRKFNK